MRATRATEGSEDPSSGARVPRAKREYRRAKREYLSRRASARIRGAAGKDLSSEARIPAPQARIRRARHRAREHTCLAERSENTSLVERSENRKRRRRGFPERPVGRASIPVSPSGASIPVSSSEARIGGAAGRDSSSEARIPPPQAWIPERAVGRASIPVSSSRAKREYGGAVEDSSTKARFPSCRMTQRNEITRAKREQDASHQRTAAGARPSQDGLESSVSYAERVLVRCQREIFVARPGPFFKLSPRHGPVERCDVPSRVARARSPYRRPTVADQSNNVERPNLIPGCFRAARGDTAGRTLETVSGGRYSLGVTLGWIEDYKSRGTGEEARRGRRVSLRFVSRRK